MSGLRQRSFLREGPVLLSLSLAYLAINSGTVQAAEASYDSRNCTFPANGTLKSPPAAPVSNKTLNDARAAAWTFAPIIYLHQLEKYAFQVS